MRDEKKAFLKAVYSAEFRKMPWRIINERNEIDPYFILVSEIMLQQTQVSRVTAKFTSFIEKFPTVSDLARASLGEVLIEWNGLGYNRRAKYLHEASKIIVQKYKDRLPINRSDLECLPGVGKNTAGAILVYAFNQPEVFIETNIRTVYIYHFFNDETAIHDNDIYPLIKETLDLENPRKFYWALMDYGSFLKKEIGNVAHRSHHHKKQLVFQGSNRQIRGQIIKLLSEKSRTLQELKRLVGDTRLQKVLTQLCEEQLITRNNKLYHLG